MTKKEFLKQPLEINKELDKELSGDIEFEKPKYEVSIYGYNDADSKLSTSAEPQVFDDADEAVKFAEKLAAEIEKSEIDYTMTSLRYCKIYVDEVTEDNQVVGTIFFTVARFKKIREGELSI